MDISLDIPCRNTGLYANQKTTHSFDSYNKQLGIENTILPEMAQDLEYGCKVQYDVKVKTDTLNIILDRLYTPTVRIIYLFNVVMFDMVEFIHRF